MEITKQDTFQVEAKTQNFKQLDIAKGSHLGQIIDKINLDLDFPLKVSASFPIPDSKINFSNSSILGPGQTIKITLSDSGSILVDFSYEVESFPEEFIPTIEGSILTAESGDIVITESGDSLVTESPESSSLNPGYLFSAYSSPIGYVKLQCTDSDGKFKTAGSTSNIIENLNIFRFDCRAQSNIGGTGETNTASNVGTGINIFKQKIGQILEFKSLVAADGLSLAVYDNTVSISTPFGEVNTASNVGAGSGLFKQKTGANLEFKSLIAGSNVSFTSGTSTVTINTISKEINTASNTGTGVEIFKQKTGANLEFKSLVAGSNIIITPSVNSVIISAAVTGENNTASNTGTGVGFFKQKVGVDLQFKTLATSNSFVANFSSDNNSVIIRRVGYYKLGDIVESALTFTAFQASRADGSTWVPLDGRSIVGSDLKNTYPYISSNLPVEARKFIKINYT